jgi:hypothetical protein
MKKIVFLVVILSLIFYSCNKDNLNMSENGIDKNRILKQLDNNTQDSQLIFVKKPVVDATAYDNGGDDFGCKGAPTDCIILDEVVIVANKQMDSQQIAQLIHPRIKELWDNGDVYLDEKDKGNRKYLFFKDNRGEIIVAYTFTVK